MTEQDLERLVALSGDASRLHEAVLDGLRSHSWGRMPVRLSVSSQATLREVIQRWISQAPLTSDAALLELIQARGPLRRLLEAMGSDWSSDLDLALHLGSAWHIDALPADVQGKVAALAHPAYADRIALAQWAERAPALAMIFAVQSLDSSGIDPASWRGLKRVVEALAELPTAQLPLFLLPALQRASFLVSYIDSDLRYVAKRTLVAQATRILRDHGLTAGALARRGQHQRARLLVVGEGLSKGHAMWRFFAQSIADLRRHFDVTLAVPANDVPSIGDLADAIVPLASSDDPVAGWRDQIAALQPDIVFYPSIGMSFTTFALSQLRLAPWQVASTGTPAPSCSAEIDATILFSSFIASADYGAVIPYDNHAMSPALNVEAGNDRPARHPSRSVPLIGINAVAMKLNDGFLATIEKVLLAVGRPCRLRFLPNVAGGELQAMMHWLMVRFPGAEIVPSTAHDGYLRGLAECDIVLQSYPFGGANTTNDALELGIPVVALQSRFLSGQTDRLLLGARGLQALCAEDENSYVALSVRLLNDDRFFGQVAAALSERRSRPLPVHLGQTSLADAMLAAWNGRRDAEALV